MFRSLFENKRSFSSSEIDPEEIFMDSVNLPDYDKIRREGRIERPLGGKVFFVWGAIMAVVFAAVFFRVFHLQIINGEYYSEEASKNISLDIFAAPERGVIYDRNMDVLASNSVSFAIVLKKEGLANKEEFSKALNAAAGVTGRPIYDIWIDNRREEDGAYELPGDLKEASVWPDEIIILDNVPRHILLRVATNPADFKGLAVEESVQRTYHLGPAGSHIIGFTGYPTASDQASSPFYKKAINRIGKSGTELFYEERLRGSPGRKVVEIDSEGLPQREFFIDKAEAGHSLVLNVDAGLQRAVYEVLARRIPALGKKAGAAIVSDPRDGRILALANFPSFDSEILSEGKDRESIKKIIGSKSKPFFNRAISGVYPPGSTVKPLLAVAALEEEIIDPKKTIYDEGFISVQNPYDPARQSIYKDWAPLGFVDMRRALAYSANVYFYTIGGGYQDIKGLGIERIRKFFKAFGFGSILGIDIAGEHKGLVPGPDEKKKIRPEDPFWRVGDTYITSIGQGDTGATPLQVNFAIAAIANGGTLFRPFITKAVLDGAGTTVEEIGPKVIRDQIARPESLVVSREGMRLAVTEGSARELYDFPLAVAGKTGTSQTGVVGKNHGWFTGFAPYNAPEVVVTVLVEEGSGGMTDAVPIAKEILWAWLAARDK